MIMYLMRLLLIICASVLITSCSTYPSKFKCGDAKGLGCTMLRDVDIQIDSGQIEEVYKKNQRRRCKGSVCRTQMLSERELMKRKAKYKAVKPSFDGSAIDAEKDMNNIWF